MEECHNQSVGELQIGFLLYFNGKRNDFSE